MSADRNLLFGVLAWQMSFIGRDALLAALQAWVFDRSRPLGAILQDQGQLSGERRQLLDALVDEHLRAHGSDAERSLAALTPLGSTRDLLRQVPDDGVQASLDRVGSAAENTADYRPAAADGLRYRVLRPHAKGNLGEVFVVEDAELHRRVALKEIQAHRADDPHSRARFLLEAEVTGNLEHPGIVPVYGLGCYGNGRPYYAMRFVRGDSLKDAIERFHGTGGQSRLAFRELLGRFVDVCQAVAYAHSRGVLHRDLKPGNILLGQYGETLVVDWGLAKVVGTPEQARAEPDGEATFHPSSGSGVAETLAGSAVGTPAFMSPEQAAGRTDELGLATDVYDLGLPGITADEPLYLAVRGTYPQIQLLRNWP